MFTVCYEMLGKKTSFCGLIMVLADVQKTGIKGIYASYSLKNYFKTRSQ